MCVHAHEYVWGAAGGQTQLDLEGLSLSSGLCFCHRRWTLAVTPPSGQWTSVLADGDGLGDIELQCGTAVDWVWLP